MTKKDLPSVGDWMDNADMIADIAEQTDWFEGMTIDLTYGEGAFWSKHEPATLIRNDLDPSKGNPELNHDYRCPLPSAWHREFKAVVFDPPYRLSGTKGTDKRSESGFDEAYGLDGFQNVPDYDVPHHLAGGIVNGTQLLARGGRMFVKCQDQQWSGKLALQTQWVEDAARSVGYTIRHRFSFSYQPQPQPPGRTQRSERSNYSSLLVLGKKGR